MIYFLRDGRAVKIGYTQDRERLAARLTTLACGNPRPLTLDAVIEGGGPRTERTLHRLLAPWRIQGEWFEARGPVARTIEHAQRGLGHAEVVKRCAEHVRNSETFRRRRTGSARGGAAHGRFVRDVANGIRR